MGLARSIVLICILFHVAARAEMSEYELNAPVEDSSGTKTLREPSHPDPGTPGARVYYFPSYSTAFGIKKALWDKAQTYYDAHWKSFPNRRYVAMVNLGLSSDVKRFYLLDLETGKVESYLTTHGEGSDPKKQGLASLFSNDINSRMSSLGAYQTLNTYIGRNGRSLYLDGLESSNSNALARAIVVHGARYVNEKNKKVGWSWGCPALDDAVAQAVIDRLQGGALLLIDSIK